MRSVSPKPILRPGAFSNITNIDYATLASNTRMSSISNTTDSGKIDKQKKRSEILMKIQSIGKENLTENEITILTEGDKSFKDFRDYSREKTTTKGPGQEKQKKEVEKLQLEILNLKKRINQEKVFARDLKNRLKEVEEQKTAFEKKHTLVLKKVEIEMANLKNNNLQLSLKHNKFIQLQEDIEKFKDQSEYTVNKLRSSLQFIMDIMEETFSDEKNGKSFSKRRFKQWIRKKIIAFFRSEHELIRAAQLEQKFNEIVCGLIDDKKNRANVSISSSNSRQSSASIRSQGINVERNSRKSSSEHTLTQKPPKAGQIRNDSHTALANTSRLRTLEKSSVHDDDIKINQFKEYFKSGQENSSSKQYDSIKTALHSDVENVAPGRGVSQQNSQRNHRLGQNSNIKNIFSPSVITQSEDLTDRDLKFSASGRESKKESNEFPAQNFMSHLQEIKSRDLLQSYNDSSRLGTKESKSKIDDHRSSHAVHLDDMQRENQNPNLPQSYSKALSHHAFSNKKDNQENYGIPQSRAFASEVKKPEQSQEFDQIFNPFANIENIFSVTQQRSSQNQNPDFGTLEDRNADNFNREGTYPSPRSEKQFTNDHEPYSPTYQLLERNQPGDQTSDKTNKTMNFLNELKKGINEGLDSGDSEWVVAKYDYVAQKPKDLSFSKGDRLRVIDRKRNGWWLAELRDGDSDQIGYIPSNYMISLD